MVTRDAALLERIRERSVDQDTGYATACWISDRTAHDHGYTRLRVNGKVVYTHRAAWSAVNGPIPDGLVIDHLCGQPPCCNPDHLDAVTQRENLSRGGGNTNAPKCRRGHPFTPENTRERKDRPGRYCRTCQRLRNEKRRLATRST
jgi:hypothetical protein